MKLCSVFYGIHPQIHIVDQTNQCDAKSNKYRFTHMEWSAIHEENIVRTAFVIGNLY